MSAHYSLHEIAAKFGGEVIGDNIKVNRVASLANAGVGSISFFVDQKYKSVLDVSQASAVVLSESNKDITGLPRIVTNNPYAYFARLSELFNPKQSIQPGISVHAVVDISAQLPSTCSIGPGAVVGADVKLGEGVVIGPGCIVGDRVEIGKNSRLEPRVVVYHDCVIGKECTLLSGSVIGADGFGYAPDNDKWVKIPQVGRVLIGDYVDIGVNTSIDRGALDDTVIEDGVKLDNLIQIGHNCVIGAHTVIAGCVGIAGSAHIGKHCRIGGAAMILGHLEIADGITISPGSMITRSLTKADTYTALMPFQLHDDWLKTAASIRHLASMVERVKKLEKELNLVKQNQDKTEKN